MKFQLLVLFLTTVLIGCRLTDNTLRGSVGTSLTSIIVNGVKGGTDSKLDAYLIDTASPYISWQRYSGATSYKVAVFEANGTTEMCTETEISENYIAFTGCDLSLGSYLFQIKAFDGDKELVSLQWPFEQVEMSLPFSSVTLLTGEVLGLVPIGGVPPFYASDQGGGYLDTNTLVYNVSLMASSGAESVTIQDSLGQSFTVNIDRRAFVSKTMLNSTNTFNYKQSIRAMTEMGSELFALGSMYSHAVVTKSTDGGATWVEVDRYSMIRGRTPQPMNIVNDGANLVYLVKTVDYNNRYRWALRLSSDGGTTWSTLTEQFVEGSSWHGWDIAMTSTGLVFVATEHPDSSTRWMIMACELATGNCEVKEALNYGTGFAKPQVAYVDANDHIYVGGRIESTNWEIRKSTDLGATWSRIMYETGGGSPEDLYVSDDGQHIVIGGSSFANWRTYESTDGGSTWSFAGNGGAWAINGIFADSTGKVFACGWENDAPNYRWHLARLDAGSWTPLQDIIFNQNTYMFIDSNDNILRFYYDEVAKSTDAGSTFPVVGQYNETLSVPLIPYAVLNTTGNTIYSTGTEDIAWNNKTGKVFKSTDGGDNWISDDSVGTDYEFFDIAQSPVTSTIVSAGKNDQNWFIRRSAGGTGPWTTVYDAAPLAGSYTKISSVTADSSGNFYALGTYYNGSTFLWHMRKSIDDGQSWADLGSYDLGGGSTVGYDVVTQGTDVWAVGTGVNGSSEAKWLVRKSTDGGSTWTNMDESSDSGTVAVALAIAPNNDIYVAGYSGLYYLTASWYVRKSSDGGVTWLQVDTVPYEVGHLKLPSGIAIDSAGNVFVSGHFVDEDNVKKAVIRYSKDGGQNWLNVDAHDIEGEGTYSSVINCFVGQVCAYGATKNNDGVSVGVMRVIDP